MRKVLNTLLLTLCLCVVVARATAPAEKSDDDIRQILIENSIKAYAGTCACPYSTNRAGNRCGKTSAYLKNGGGRRPLCYPSDVTERMIAEYKKR